MELIKISVFLVCVFMALREINGYNGSCNADQWKCLFGCIPASKRCDNVIDCILGTDEQYCDGFDGREGCNIAQFQCGDGQCIPATWRCDKPEYSTHLEWAQCEDGSDEQNCPAHDAVDIGLDVNITLHTEPAIWSDARKVCQQSGLELTKVASQLMLNTAMEILQASGYTGNVWVDGEAMFEPFNWVVFSDVTLLLFPLIPIWHDGEPNKSGTCLHLRNDGTGHKLDDTSCDYPQAFLCGEPLPEPGGQNASYYDAMDICKARGKTLYTVNTQHSFNQALSVMKKSHGILSTWVDGILQGHTLRYTDESWQFSLLNQIWHDEYPSGHVDRFSSVNTCLYILVKLEWNGYAHVDPNPKMANTWELCFTRLPFLCG